ncbi:MAG: 3-deoxy-D-manno-octulosonic acid transferase [Deferribacterales bacterium]
MLIFLPFYILSIFIKGIRNRDYYHKFSGRFALIEVVSAQKSIWIHALSVGEVNAAAPLIRKLLVQFSEYKIIVTTTTPTGMKQVIKLFRNTVEHHYIPYDLSIFVKIFFRKIKPVIGIIVETEIWPNIIYNAKKFGIPTILVNGRMSEKSKNRYKLLNGIIKNILNNFKMIIVRDEEDAKRFKELGVEEERLRIAGNIKFDIDIDNKVLEKGNYFKSIIGERKIFTAGSTHEGEEEIILKVFKTINSNLLLVVAPRDPLRSKDIIELVKKFGLKGLLRTEIEQYNSSINVIVVDTLGELLSFYSISDVAFVGGSLVKKGGHNPLEPLLYGVPTCAGEYIYNFSELYSILTKKGLLKKVKNESELRDVVNEFLSGSVKMSDLYKRITNFINENRGATDKVCLIIYDIIYQ